MNFEYENIFTLRAFIVIIADSFIYIPVLIVLGFHIFTTYKKKTECNRLYIVTDIFMIFYFFYLYCADIMFCIKSLEGKSLEYINYYLFDPILIVFFITSLFLMLELFKNIKKATLKEHDFFMSHSHEINKMSLEAVKEKYGLSSREFEILSELLRGKSNSEIAESLNISIYTVRKHVNSILKKTELSSRFALITKILIKQ